MTKLPLLALSFLAATAATARPFTPDDLVNLARVEAPVVSPDGHWLAWSQRETDLAANRGRHDLWRLDLKRAGAVPERIASLPQAEETDPQFGRDGALYFLSDRAGGKSAVWRVAMTGGAATPVTSAAYDLAGFSVAPTGDRLVVWADRPVGAQTLDASQPKPAANAGSGRTFDQLFVRHWDAWADGQRQQLFVLPLAGGKAAGPGRSITGGLVGDAPGKPFGGREGVTWSPNGRTIYFALREAGRIEPLSTNFDIFAAPADASAPPTDLTPDNRATDTLPAVSPDGRWLAWAAMKRPGYESDRQVLWVRELATGQTHAVTEGWDRSVGSIAWSPDSASLYVTADDTLDHPVFRVDLGDGQVHRLTGIGHADGVVALPGGGIAYQMNNLLNPDDLWRMEADGRATQLTHVNAARLAGVDRPVMTRLSFKGAGGDTVWGYGLRPANLPAGAKAPTVLIVHGGPQGSFGDSWSYRWNSMAWAGHGVAVVSVDFHGSTGYGQAFTDAINRDWGGKPLADLKAGLKYATDQLDFIDGSRVCAAGGSYGGYMMNWIEGSWPDRFRCIVQHDGVFDARAMAYETDELWFDEYEHGGRPYYEAWTEFERWNPVAKVADWKTPQLVITSEKDFRIPYTQGLATFTALQRRGIPSRLLVFPDENHWVLKPKNSLQWHHEVFAWLDRWIGPGAGK